MAHTNPFDDPHNPHYVYDPAGNPRIHTPIVEEVFVHNTDGEICVACLARDGVERVHDVAGPSE